MEAIFPERREWFIRNVSDPVIVLLHWRKDKPFCLNKIVDIGALGMQAKLPVARQVNGFVIATSHRFEPAFRHPYTVGSFTVGRQPLSAFAASRDSVQLGGRT